MSSFISRLSSEMSNMGNAFNDAYGNLLYGDDAGKAAKLVFIANPKISSKKTSSLYYHGMTFIEVNDRAYVRSVDPKSDAHRAGVKPRDCVQLALVLGESLNHLKNNNTEAAKYGLECEKDGMRTSCTQLKHIIGESCFAENPKALDNRAGQEEYYTQSSFINITPDKNRNNSPSASVKIRHGVTHFMGMCGGNNTTNNDTIDRDETTSQQQLFSSPILFVLRRTRQRVPSASPTSAGLVSFRLDDECDRAADFIHRLANTTLDSSSPSKTRAEIFYDGKNWFLPPLSTGTSTFNRRKNDIESEDCIKLSNEKIDNLRSIKLAKDIITEESSKEKKRPDELETKAIRALIQTAVGLAFIRTSKFVLGVSLNAGSGIIIARLPDGTWSPPSALGMMGAGLGLQFGLEVVDYIFILQTRQSLDNFRRGGHFTVGGNVGAAVAGLGREAYGAASLGGSLCAPNTPPTDNKHDDDSDDDMTPPPTPIAEFSHVMAYAKSQGLYFGVSLEGNRIYTRDDLNCRSYKFSTGKFVHAYDVLDGKVPIPPEAENLYASLHSLEYNHEISDLPRPPTILREFFCKDWNCNQPSPMSSSNKSEIPSLPFFSSLSEVETADCLDFESKIKDFLFGGVSVLRLIPGSEDKDGMTRCQRRTLWLMEPPQGTLRIGFISKGVEEGIAPRQNTKNDWARNQHNIFLSKKNSIALTDVLYLGQNPNFPIRFCPDDDTDHLRIISIADINGNCLLFIPDNMRVSELIVYGLKLLLEKETSRLGVKGGIVLSELDKSASSGADRSLIFKEKINGNLEELRIKNSSSSSENNEEKEWSDFDETFFGDDRISSNEKIPEGKKSWAKVPARNFLRDQASKSINKDGSISSPTKEFQSKPEISTNSSNLHYDPGQPILRDVASNVKLPVPLHHGRALLLDPTSPVSSSWEESCGDKNTSRERWRFPKGSARNNEQYINDSSLIANGHMTRAYRHVRYECIRNGEKVELTETQTIEVDNESIIKLNIREHLQRRGFSVNIYMVLRKVSSQYCEASVTFESSPLGKNMPSQVVTQRLRLLQSEIKMRYGKDEPGFLACFLNMARKISYSSKRSPSKKDSETMKFKNSSSVPSLEGTNASSRRKDISISNTNNRMKTKSKQKHSKEMLKNHRNRPGTPSLDATGTIASTFQKEGKRNKYPSSDFAEFPNSSSLEGKGNESASAENHFKPSAPISVKPLPKIRLDLMPSPREEDEDQSHFDSPSLKSKGSKYHRSKSRHRLGKGGNKKS